MRAGVRRPARLPARLRPRPGLGARAPGPPAPPRRDRPGRRPRPAACEDGLLDLFADLGSLYQARADRPRRRRTPAGRAHAGVPAGATCNGSTRTGPGCPTSTAAGWSARCTATASTGWTASPALEEAVVWLFRSVHRVDRLAPGGHQHPRPAACATTRRWAELADAEMRARLDRLAGRCAGPPPGRRRPGPRRAVPLPRRAAAGHRGGRGVRPGRAATSTRWRADPGRSRPRPAGRPAWSPARSRCAGAAAPLARPPTIRAATGAAGDVHPPLLPHPATARPALRRAGRLVAVHRRTTTSTASGIHLVTGYAPLDELPALSRGRWPPRCAAADPDRPVVVDLSLWRRGRTGADRHGRGGAGQARSAPCDFGRALLAARPHRHHRRTARTQNGSGPTTSPTGSRDGAFVEDEPYRNLHPMLAERLDLWRLSNFRLQRLRSAEDVYVFHGVAHDNPADRRLFALAEVRDLTPARDASGAVRYPRLELMGLLALSAMREALNDLDERHRPAANRIVLYVRPVWDVPRAAWTGAGPLAGAPRRRRRPGEGRAAGTAARTAATRVLHVEGLDGGVTVRERPRAGSRSGRCRRTSRRCCAPRGSARRTRTRSSGCSPRHRARCRGFPTGQFTEYDLDASGALVPVTRPPGRNTANIVVGVLRNHTAKVPEGMVRVALLGDPTRGLGNVAEPECRRIIAGARPGGAAGSAGGVVRAVLRRADRDGQRHREHGLDRRCAAPAHRVHPGRRRASTSSSPA